MKKIAAILLIIGALLLLPFVMITFPCSKERGDMDMTPTHASHIEAPEEAATFISESAPSPEPIEEKMDSYVPRTTIDEEDIAKLRRGLDNEVRLRLDFDAPHMGPFPDGLERTDLTGYEKQETRVDIYATKGHNGYSILFMLDDDLFYATASTYHRIWFFNSFGKIEDPTNGRKRYEIEYPYITSINYTFDPDCKEPFEDMYFYMWERDRKKIIDLLINHWSFSYFSGDITLEFCGYSELFVYNPGNFSAMAFFKYSDGRDYYAWFNYGTDGFYADLKYTSDLSEKQIAYLRASEFDRETVCLP